MIQTEISTHLHTVLGNKMIALGLTNAQQNARISSKRKLFSNKRKTENASNTAKADKYVHWVL